MPEYKRVKGQTRSLDFFKNPELAAKITLDAQRILGVDAAIMFADLLPMLEPMGFELDYKEGVGPWFSNPIEKADDVELVRVVEADDELHYIVETITNILADLPTDIALIGFAGAPFTLASYVIEGQSSRDFAKAKRFMYTQPQAWHQLLNKITSTVIDYALLQIRSGVQAVQIFDSWLGTLSLADYLKYVDQHVRRLMSGICGRVPIIYFGVGNAHLLEAMQETGCDFLALDWRVPLKRTWDQLGSTAIQGNLDPLVLCADSSVIESATKDLLDSVEGKPGYIFNLGHGIVPSTPVDNVKRLVDLVHAYTS